ncbi:SAM-dependent methyltransferase [Actinoplanes sp. N902-109]|uniref:SAM-dependent methyltransferase n=1 Tax=Actinoplanes sp. (strain N902-109) TaxID=649831 RepID=UPI00039B86A9|nr:SAM-dependent methyltransferase [Actinoplanes sp. N902-109]
MASGDTEYSSRPSSARIYDALLGGNHNFAADREAAQHLLTAIPLAGEMARANRAFLNRAVQYMLDRGVRQFLDIGSGIPTVGNVHEIAQRRVPDARVVYVDIDPVAVAHSNDILKDNPWAAAIQADLRFPEAVLEHPSVRRLIDPEQPIGLLLVAMLHFVPDDGAYEAVGALRSILPRGSYVVISHGVSDTPADAAQEQVTALYRRTDVAAAHGRTRDGIMRFFGDAELVPPGLVWVHEWPDGGDGEPHGTAVIAGVARVTGSAPPAAP